MTSQNPRLDIYDPKTLAVTDHAFATIWNPGENLPSGKSY